MYETVDYWIKLLKNGGDGKETTHGWDLDYDDKNQNQKKKRSEEIDKLRQKVKKLQKRNHFEFLSLETAKMIDQYFGVAAKVQSIRPAETDREKQKIQKLLKKAKKMQNVLMERIDEEIGYL